MTTTNKALVMTAALCLVGVLLALAVREFGGYGKSDKREGNGFGPVIVATTSTKPENLPLSKTTCEKAGGTWNDCGSPCRGLPTDRVCAQVCLPQCECNTVTSACPVGYYCKSEIASGDGACMRGEASKAPEPAKTPQLEFKSAADKMTSADLSRNWSKTDGDVVVLHNPFFVSGTTTVFENQFSWKLLDASGAQVAGGQAYANSPDMGQPGPFSITGFYGKIPQAATGTLVLFDNSPKDGAEIRLLEMPVRLETRTVEVQVFFGNTVKNPNAMDCSLVYPVKRTEVAGDGRLAAIAELLKGPTAAEKRDGYYTSLPEGVSAPNIGSSADALRLEFDESLQRGVGGSCRVSAIRSQIERTAKQNDLEKNVIISINGRTEDILQP